MKTAKFITRFTDSTDPVDIHDYEDGWLFRPRQGSQDEAGRGYCCCEKVRAEGKGWCRI
jgi:hypothetical protein